VAKVDDELIAVKMMFLGDGGILISFFFAVVSH
jgi:hypothetical protein